MRTSKLQSFKDDLESDQPNFLRKKMETLMQIMEDEEKYDLPKEVQCLLTNFLKTVERKLAGKSLSQNLIFCIFD